MQLIKILISTGLIIGSLVFTGCAEDTETAASTGAATATDGTDGTTATSSTDGADGTDGALEPVPVAGVSCDAESKVCLLEAAATNPITEDFRMVPGYAYVLNGAVFFGDDTNPATLTIDAGVTVYGEPQSFLVVQRGATIVAEGTATNPIVFTSAAETPAVGDWGGVVINGLAPTNGCADESAVCELPGEADTGFYGGNDPEDNSGIFKYVRIEWAGYKVNDSKELNGLALQGVGSGTTLEYIHVNRGNDDGIEFFGGTAHLKWAIVTGMTDDGIDWTGGWTGKAQFLVVQQTNDTGDRGFECDNNGDSLDALPRSQPLISNVTAVGGNGPEGNTGITLRAGTAGQVWNAIMTNWKRACLDIDDGATFTNAYDGTALTGNLAVAYSIAYCPGSKNFSEEEGDPWTIEEFFTSWNDGNLTDDPKLADPFNLTAPGFAPGEGSPAVGAGFDMSATDAWFTSTDYIGAVGPENDWVAQGLADGWIKL
jgi:hypothetical protein